MNLEMRLCFRFCLMNPYEGGLSCENPEQYQEVVSGEPCTTAITDGTEVGLKTSFLINQDPTEPSLIKSI